ncbi:MAG: hypothetical protein K9J13_11235 [Saprospiraceae bacterium]|nr:hypothetical protein [Saprospiraceae bacterium]
MKKFILSLLLISLIIPVFSQTSYFHFYEPSEYYIYGMYYSSCNSALKKDVKKYGITDYKIYKEIYKKGNIKHPKYLSLEYVFDKNGNKTAENHGNKKGEIYNAKSIAYNDSNKVTEIILKNKKGIIRKKFNYEYSDFTKLTSYTKFGRKAEKIKWKEDRKYNSDNKLIERLSYKNGDKCTGRFEYTYYPSGDIKETRMYNKKDKLKKVWSYACKSDGEEIVKHKDTVEVCVWEEHKDDGFLYKTSRYTNEKGKITKYVSKHTKDSVLVANMYYNEKNQMTYQTTFHTKYNDFYEYISYRKGKEISKRTSKYNSDDKIISFVVLKKGKFSSKYIYVYDDNENCTSTVYYKKNETEFKSKTDYIYNDKNLKLESTTFNKKNELIKKYFYEYEYVH